MFLIYSLPQYGAKVYQSTALIYMGVFLKD